MSRFALVLTLFAGLSLSLMGREFTSADGSKKVEAEFIRLNSKIDKVTLRIDGRNSVLPATAFSQEDQTFFEQEQKKVDMKEAVTVKIDTKSRTERSKDDKGKKSSAKNTEFSFIVKNESYSALDGLKLKYWVLVETENKEERGSTINVQTQEVAVDALEPGEETTINGPTITQKKGEGKGKGGEVSIYGAKAQLYSPAGDELGCDVSSDRVENYLNR